MSPTDPAGTWRRHLALRRSLAQVRAEPGLADPLAPARERLLMVWDWREVPLNLGDILVLHARAACLCHRFGVDTVDIAFVCVPEDIGATNPKYDSGVHAGNFHQTLAGLVPMVYLSRRVGSFLVFDSYELFDRYLEANLDRYHVWPTAEQVARPQFAFGRNWDALQQYYLDHRFLPYLECRPAPLRWAARFFLDQVAPSLPVVVQLRNNPRRSVERNARLEVWDEFFRRCEGSHDLKFILIGAAAEIDPRFRGRPNVLVAKDFGTSIEQDFVLAHCPAVYLGGPSGPATMALLSPTPYVVFNYRTEWETIPDSGRFTFATELQRLTFEPETPETLWDQFSFVHDRLAPGPWWERIRRQADAGRDEGGESNLLWDAGATR